MKTINDLKNDIRDCERRLAVAIRRKQARLALRSELRRLQEAQKLAELRQTREEAAARKAAEAAEAARAAEIEASRAEEQARIERRIAWLRSPAADAQVAHLESLRLDLLGPARRQMQAARDRLRSQIVAARQAVA